MTTEIYCLKPSAYVRQIMARWLGRYRLALLSPVATALVFGATADVRFFFVALMLLFLIVPFALSHVYFSYALKPEAAACTGWQRLELDDDGTLRTVRATAPGSEQPASGAGEVIAEVRAEEMRGISTSGASVAVVTGKRHDSLMVIPNEAFSGDADMKRRFVEYLCAKIEGNRVNLQS